MFVVAIPEKDVIVVVVVVLFVVMYWCCVDVCDGDDHVFLVVLVVADVLVILPYLS